MPRCLRRPPRPRFAGFRLPLWSRRRGVGRGVASAPRFATRARPRWAGYHRIPGLSAPGWGGLRARRAYAIAVATFFLEQLSRAPVDDGLLRAAPKLRWRMRCRRRSPPSLVRRGRRLSGGRRPVAGGRGRRRPFEPDVVARSLVGQGDVLNALDSCSTRPDPRAGGATAVLLFATRRAPRCTARHGGWRLAAHARAASLLAALGRRPISARRTSHVRTVVRGSIGCRRCRAAAADAPSELSRWFEAAFAVPERDRERPAPRAPTVVALPAAADARGRHTLGWKRAADPLTMRRACISPPAQQRKITWTQRAGAQSLADAAAPPRTHARALLIDLYLPVTPATSTPSDDGHSAQRAREFCPAITTSCCTPPPPPC